MPGQKQISFSFVCFHGYLKQTKKSQYIDSDSFHINILKIRVNLMWFRKVSFFECLGSGDTRVCPSRADGSAAMYRGHRHGGMSVCARFQRVADMAEADRVPPWS